MATLWDLLSGAAYVADTPGAYTRGLLAGRPGERVSGRDMLAEWGLVDDPSSMAGSMAGLGAEVLLDPLNWAGGGGIALLRRAAMREAAEEAAQRAAMEEAEMAARLAVDSPIPLEMLDDIPSQPASMDMLAGMVPQGTMPVDIPQIPLLQSMREARPAIMGLKIDRPIPPEMLDDVPSEVPPWMRQPGPVSEDLLGEYVPSTGLQYPPQQIPPGILPAEAVDSLMPQEVSPLLGQMLPHETPLGQPFIAPESLPPAPGVPSPVPEMNAAAGQPAALNVAPAVVENTPEAAARLAENLPADLRLRQNQPPGTVAEALSPAGGRFAGKSEEELRDMLAMYDDNIRTKRAKGESVPQQWVDGASEIRAILGGDDPGKFIYADESVYGNPLFAGNRPGHENLVPIKIDANADLTWRIDAVQKRINEIQSQIGKANAAVKMAKTPAARKKAEAAMNSANFSDLKMELDDLNQTHRYLGRLQDQQRAKFGSVAPPPTLEDALSPGTPVEPTPAPKPSLTATLEDYQNAIGRYRDAGAWSDVSDWLDRATRPRGGLKVAELKTLAESLGVQVQGKRTDIVAQLEGWVRAKGKVPQTAVTKPAGKRDVLAEALGKVSQDEGEIIPVVRKPDDITVSRARAGADNNMQFDVIGPQDARGNRTRLLVWQKGEGGSWYVTDLGHGKPVDLATDLTRKEATEVAKSVLDKVVGRNSRTGRVALSAASTPAGKAAVSDAANGSLAKQPYEMSVEEFESAMADRELATLHTARARENGLVAVSDGEVRRYFESLRDAGRRLAGDSAPDVDRLVNSAERAWHSGNFGKAIEDSEMALSLTHSNLKSQGSLNREIVWNMHRESVQDAINAGVIQSHPDYPELSSRVSAKAVVSDPTEAVRQALLQLSGGSPDKRIRLAELRSSLSSVERQQLDKALLDMEKRGEIIAYPIEDPTDLKAADEAAALPNSAGFKRHILYLGETPAVTRNSDDAMLEELMREQADEMAAEEAAAAARRVKKKDAPVVDKPPEIQPVVETPAEAPAPKTLEGEVEFTKEKTTSGRKEFAAYIKTVDPETGQDHFGNRLEIRQVGRGGEFWEVVNTYYDKTSGSGRKSVVLATGVRKSDAKQAAEEYLRRVTRYEPGGKLTFAQAEADLATDPAVARALRLRKIEPQQTSVKEAWRGNMAGDNRLLSDGIFVVDSEVAEKQAVAALRKAEGSGKVSQESVRKALDEYWREISNINKTDPATVLGKELETGRVFVAVEKKSYAFDATRFAYIQRITGADSYRVAKFGSNRVLIFDKDGKPAAMLMQLGGDKEELAMDLPTALKRAASWQSPAKGKKR